MITVLWLLCGLGLAPLAFSQRRAVVDLSGGLTTTKPSSADVDSQAEAVVPRTPQTARQRPMPWPHNRSFLPRRVPGQNATTTGPTEFVPKALTSQPRNTTHRQPVTEEEEKSRDGGGRSETSNEITRTTTLATVTIPAATTTPSTIGATISEDTPLTEIHIHSSEHVHTSHDTHFQPGDEHDHHMATGNRRQYERDPGDGERTKPTEDGNGRKYDRDPGENLYYGKDGQRMKPPEDDGGRTYDRDPGENLYYGKDGERKKSTEHDTGRNSEGRPTDWFEDKPSSSPDRRYFVNKTTDDEHGPESHTTEAKGEDRQTGVNDRNRPRDEGRYRPIDGDRYRPRNENRYRPKDEDKYIPSGEDRYRTRDEDRYRPSDEDRYRPRDEDRYRPGDGDRYRPSDERYRPDDEHRYRPGDGDRYRPSDERYRPDDEDRYRPREEDRYRPGDGDRYRPRDEDRYRPSDEDRYKQSDKDRHRPTEGNRYRPRNENPNRPKEDDRYIPRDSDRYRPDDAHRYRPEDYERHRPGDGDRYRPSGSDRLGPKDDDHDSTKGDDRNRPLDDYIPRRETQQSPKDSPNRYRPKDDDRYKPREDGDTYIPRDDSHRNDGRYRPNDEGRYRPNDEDRYRPYEEDRYRPKEEDQHRPSYPPILGDRNKSTGEDGYISGYDDSYKLEGDRPYRTRDDTQPSRDSNTRRYGVDYYRPRDGDRYSGEDDGHKYKDDSERSHTERNKHAGVNSGTRRDNSERNGDHNRNQREPGHVDGDQVTTSSVSIRNVDSKRPPSHHQDGVVSTWASGDDRRDSNRRREDHRYSGTHSRDKDRDRNSPDTQKDTEGRRRYYPTGTYGDTERTRLRDEGRSGDDRYESRYFYPPRAPADDRKDDHDGYSPRDISRGNEGNRRQYNNNDRRHQGNFRYPGHSSSASRTPERSRTYYSGSRGWDESRDRYNGGEIVLDRRSHVLNDSNSTDVVMVENDKYDARNYKEDDGVKDNTKLISSDRFPISEVYTTVIEEGHRTEEKGTRLESDYGELKTESFTDREAYRERHDEILNTETSASHAANSTRTINADIPEDHLSERVSTSSERIKEPESDYPLSVRHVIEASQRESEIKDSNKNIFYPVLHPRSGT